MMIANKINKLATKEGKNITRPSSFAVKFTDNSKIDESVANWSDMASEKIVQYGKGEKTVKLCDHPASSITIKHAGLETTINVPKGCQVYQATRAETTFLPNGTKTDKILGKVVGVVKDDKVIEERFIDELQRNIIGFKLQS